MVSGVQDRIPPHNIEAEQAVLGAIFLEPDSFSIASEVLLPEDFYRASHQRIYKAMFDLFEQGEPIDIVTVTTVLKNAQTLDEVGGVSYLSELADSVPTAANIAYYRNIVEEKALLRRLIRTATDIVTFSFANEGEVDDVLTEAERNILEVYSRGSVASINSLVDVIDEVYSIIEYLKVSDGEINGL